MFHYTDFVIHVECHEWSAGAHFRMLCAVGNANAFAVTAALVATHWQHRV